MCGIVGYFKNEHNSSIRSADMLSTISHRGLDGKGYFEDDYIVLGHTRLSIVDIENGQQPYIHENLVIVFNGEIYNHKYIRGLLESQGYEFETNSDTEVLLKAYMSYGSSCLDLFNGMYAFVIYDKDSKSIVFSRDYFGIKPLYFYHRDEYFYFSSEVNSLLFMLKRSDIEVSISGEAQNEYMENGCIVENSIIKNFFEARHGDFLCFRNATVSLVSEVSFSDIDIVNKSLEDVLKLQLEEELMADVEVGVLLSGGIDSSLLTAISADLKDRIKTFSISFDNGDVYDESRYSKFVAEKFSTDHHQYLFDEETLLGYLPTLVETMDMPIYDPAMLPMLYLMDKVSTECKVVLSGDGGDEIFAGYTHHRVLKYRKIFSAINYFCGKLHIFKNKNRTLTSLLSEANGLSESLDFGQRTSLNARLLRKTDLCSMRNGVEVRVPFLSGRVLKYSRQFDASSFLNLFHGKLPLRRLVKKYTNHDIAYRKKQGFRVPICEWVGVGELGEIIERELSGKLYIDNKAVSLEDVGKWLEDKKRYHRQLFSAYLLNTWLKKIEGI